jgi:type IV secretory pathway VirB10-like protein
MIIAFADVKPTVSQLLLIFEKIPNLKTFVLDLEIEEFETAAIENLAPPPPPGVPPFPPVVTDHDIEINADVPPPPPPPPVPNSDEPPSDMSPKASILPSGQHDDDNDVYSSEDDEDKELEDEDEDDYDDDDDSENSDDDDSEDADYDEVEEEDIIRRLICPRNT